MRDFQTAPFSGPKRKSWVWIVPSVLLHIVVIAVWLLLPEPEPRQPGERKLTIKEEQAEELQEHVEKANLKKLREKVSELQSIKATMVRIRAQEMEAVSEFEQDRVEEAPQDIAALLLELAGIYESVQEDYARIGIALDLYAREAPAIRKAGEQDIVEGLRLLPKLNNYWSAFEGMGDRFEVAFFETGATVKEIEVKLEWVEDPAIASQVEALKEPMETAEGLHKEAWGSVPASWKRARSFSQLTEDVDATIATVERFRQSEKDGKAEVAQTRAALEGQIAGVEAKLDEATKSLEAEKAALGAINSKEAQQSWRAQREKVRALERETGQLQQELQNLNRSLSRTEYKEDRRLANEVKQITNHFNHALPELPDRGQINRAVAQLQEMVRRLEAFAKTLEVPR
ncbi:MAG TPA: hypothetical protein VJ952_01860 [Opitutales bacterium]|nr:hypothetical protein [Opitutales bacterium]